MYILRELSRKDIPQINKWRRDSTLISLLGAPFRFICIEVEYEWFDNYLKSRSNNVKCCIVDDNNEEEIIGLVSLSSIDAINQTAKFHIMIGEEKNRNKGIGYITTKKMLNHGFENLNLNRIELEVLEYNKKAIKMYEKAGFVKEGIKRQANYKNGEFIDCIIMSILKKDFQYE